MDASNLKPGDAGREPAEANPQSTDANPVQRRLNPGQAESSSRSMRSDPPPQISLAQASAEQQSARGRPEAARVNPQASSTLPGPSYRTPESGNAEAQLFGSLPEKPLAVRENTRATPEQAQADLEQVRPYLQQAQEDPAKAHGKQATKHLNKAEAKQERAQAYLRQAQADLEEHRADLEEGQAYLDEAQAHLDAAQAHIDQARADEEQARADEEQARADEEQGQTNHSSSSGSQSEYEDDSVEPEKHRYKSGDLIFFEEPYSAVLSDTEFERACSHCFGLIPPCVTARICKRCETAIYCSDGCLAADGLDHEVECVVFSNSEDIPPEYDRLGVRVLSRHIRETERGEVFQTSFFHYARRIDNIVSHIQDTDEETIKSLRVKAQSLKRRMSRFHQYKVSIDEFLEVFLKIRINAQYVYNSESNTVSRLGTALFLGASKMDHTCSQIDKYALTFNGPDLVVTALEPFTLEEPKTLKINYITINQSLQERRRLLSDRWFFDCRCRRCKSDKGDDERNLPEDLRAFMYTPVRSHWEQKAREFYEIIQNFPPKNFFRYVLAYNLQFLCSRQGKTLHALRYGMAALAGSTCFEERKQILYMLCTDMVKLGYDKRSHRCNTDLRITCRSALKLFYMVLDSNHMVEELELLFNRQFRLGSGPDRRWLTD